MSYPKVYQIIKIVCIQVESLGTNEYSGIQEQKFDITSVFEQLFSRI